MDDRNGSTKERFVVEEKKRLSESLLWSLQRRYFAASGPSAWSKGTVPHWITSNAFIASAYAKIVSAFIDDCAKDTSLNPDQPIHCIELGAGSGRFAFNFLRSFEALQHRVASKRPTLKYVMTDFVEATIAAWQRHPSLRPYVEKGLLDFARFDGQTDDRLRLEHGRQTLAPEAPQSPIVLLANYYFDGIPQDAFICDGGEISEALVTLTSNREEPDLQDPSMLFRLQLGYEPSKIEAPYYADATLDQILERYRQRLAATTFTIPTAALAECGRLARLGGNRLFVLSADKGSMTEESLLGQQPPGIAVHGSFSMNVNYHAIGEYFRLRGGAFLRSRHAHRHLAIGGFLLVPEPARFEATKEAFTEAIGRFGPDDFFALKKGIEGHFDDLDLEAIVALIRLSDHDSRILSQCLKRLSELCTKLSPSEKEELVWTIRRVWDGYYHLGEKEDLAFQLGLLLLGLNRVKDAQTFFQRSLEIWGPDTNTFFNLALCDYQMQREEEALKSLTQALAIDPTHSQARAMMIEIQARLERALSEKPD